MGTTEGAPPHDAPGDDRLGSQGMMPPRADTDLSRARVVQAVVDLVMDGGYSAVTWEAVAGRSGLSLAEVQQHGATLDDLLLTTLEACLQRWITTAPTWTRVDPVPGLSDEISRRLLTGLDAAAESPEFWVLGMLLCLTSGDGARRARSRYAEVRASARAAIAEWWSRILPAGTVAADPRLPHRLTGVHLALVDGAFVAQRSGVEWNLPVLVRTVSAGLSSYLVGTEVAP